MRDAESPAITNAGLTGITADQAEQNAKDAAAKAAADPTEANKQAAADTAATAKAADTSADKAMQTAASPGSGTSSGGSCSALSPSTWGDCLAKVVGGAILSVANFLLAAAGTLLNWVVIKTVFQFGSLIGNSPGLLLAWGIMRDIGNMLLLFGFIFMGIATILDLHTFSARKALPSLIIFAILMNFSLFAAEAIIDTSNAFSSVIYAQANTDPCTGILGGSASSGGQTEEDCAVNYGLAGHIMESTGLSTIFATNDSSFSAGMTTYIMLALFATIGAVVMVAASIMLVFRVVVLSFVMVAAPIGFAGMAIPPLRKFAGDWWHRLLAQSFFVPVMFLLIFISLKITDTFASTDTRGSLAAAVQQPGSSVMGIIMIFTIIIGFLIASLIVAKNMGAAGASFAVKNAGRFTYGTMGFAGRQTSGRAFNALNERIRKSEFGQTSFGRRVAMVTEKGAKGSYDFRATAAGSALSKRVGDLGKPQKGGYAGQVKHQTEEYTKYGGTLKQTDAAKAREKQLNNKKKTITESRTLENTRWDKEKQEQEAELAELKSSIASREKERAEQSGRLNSAIASGDQAAYRRESESMESLMSTHQTLDAEANEKITASQKALEEGKKRHESFINGFDDELKRVDVEIKGDMDKGVAGVDSNSSKRQFAINIKNSSVPWKGPARAKAFDAIKADLKKTKAEKAIEGLKHSIDEGTKDTSHKLDDVKHALDEEAEAEKHKSDDHHGGDSHGGH